MLVVTISKICARCIVYNSMVYIYIYTIYEKDEVLCKEKWRSLISERSRTLIESLLKERVKYFEIFSLPANILIECEYFVFASNSECINERSYCYAFKTSNFLQLWFSLVECMFLRWLCYVINARMVHGYLVVISEKVFAAMPGVQK